VIRAVTAATKARPRRVGLLFAAAVARERLRLGVIGFALSDTPGPLWPGHCGLFGLDGSAKPSWNAFTELTGGSADDV
jgi:hypothetical protein